MSRFILRFRGPGAVPPDQWRKIRSCPGLKVIDDSSPRMALVEAEGGLPKPLREALDDWMVTKETFTPLPDTREKVADRNSE